MLIRESHKQTTLSFQGQKLAPKKNNRILEYTSSKKPTKSL